MWRDDEIEQLADRLKGFRRVLFWGGMGTGKSTLALDLTRFTSRRTGHLSQVLALDPGTPLFGVPGALNRGQWRGGDFGWAGCRGLCTLDAARFRLPLVQAAGRLLDDAVADDPSGSLAIDPPGVVRGVAGAELLTALVMALQVDAVVVLSRQGQPLPLAAELNWLPAEVLQLPAAARARRPTKRERAARRTGLWDRYLGDGIRQSYRLEDTEVLGTPPPGNRPDAWKGRQAALIDSRGRTLAMGEVIELADGVLTVRLAAGPGRVPAGILIRDAGRKSDGRLETMAHVFAPDTDQRVPGDATRRGNPNNEGSPPVFSRVGQAVATLVGGVFGDPLVHVRLRNQKQSLFFDLGDPARLAARTAHQVGAVCLSHAHMDHIGGFVWFLRSRIGSFGPCKIFGPRETITRIENFLGAITWDRIEENAPVFEVCEFDGDRLKRARLQPGSPSVGLDALPVEDGVLLAEDNLSLRAAICDHKIPTIAYALCFRMEISVRKERLMDCGLAPGPWLGRLKQCIAAQTLQVNIALPDGTRRSAGDLARELTLVRPGKKLVYAADMADTLQNREKVIDLAQGAHTLFCETAFMMAHQDKAGATQHLTTRAAVEIARKAGVSRLVPFHFSKRYEHDPDSVYREILAAAGPVKIIGRRR